MTTRHAACSCGQLRVACTGEPVRISVCHCLACQRRTGSVFGAQARFPRERVTIEGRATQWTRVADSGETLTFSFCPVCGTTLYYRHSVSPELVAVTLGGFADPNFPPPRHSVYEKRRHAWVGIETGAPIERLP
jgi:hypothetical protein